MKSHLRKIAKHEAYAGLTLLALVACLLCACPVSARTLTWQFGRLYAVDEKGFAMAVADAKRHFLQAPDDTIVLQVPAGRFYLAQTQGKGTIDLSGVQPGPQGRLIIQGAGKNATTLVFSDAVHAIYGRDVYRVSLIGMHMTRNSMTVTQGHVLECQPGSVVLDIEKGFPSPASIFNPKSGQGRYLRAYSDNPNNPRLIQENNEQIPWVSAYPISGSAWQINLKRKNQIAPYPKGALVAVKSKRGGQAYWFSRGSDILFQDIKWTQESRGVFRNGFDKIHFFGCEVDRAQAISGHVPCLSTPDGGPQIGQPNDPATKGNIIENCLFTGTGDDSIAFFNSTGTIRNCQIADSFGRGILLVNSPNVVLENNSVVRCPVLQVRADGSEKQRRRYAGEWQLKQTKRPQKVAARNHEGRQSFRPDRST